MSTAGLALPLQVSLPGETAIMVLVVLVGGLVGMSIRNVLGSLVTDEDGEESEDTDGDDEGLGELGGLDDGDDLGGLGGLDDDGEMGGLDDEGFNDGGGAEFDEIEGRIDELENELGGLSSTVSTVRSENEQIAESVDEVEENVRKLLDIYEMVTRGVNPFADDVDAGMGGGGLDGGGSFGIFDDDEDEPAEDIDESVVEADAEGFFDDDLVEEDGFEEGGLDDDFESEDTDDTGGGFDEAFAEEGDDGFGGDGFDDEFDDEFDGGFDEGGLDDGDTDGDGDGDGDDGGSTSFEELKSEYESGEADWADDVESSEGGDGETTGEKEPDESRPQSDRADDEDTDDTDTDAETAGGTEELGGLADDELFDEVIEEDADGDDAEITAAETDTVARSATDGGGQPQALSRSEDAETDAGGEDSGAPAENGSTDQEVNTSQEAPASPGRERDRSETGARASAATDGGKPYLAALPEGLATELIVFEWLEFLVTEGGIRETARALEYYERVDWIDERVREQLDAYLAGFDETGDGALTIEHHTTSLEYIDQLEGGNTIVTAGLGQGGRDGF